MVAARDRYYIPENLSRKQYLFDNENNKHYIHIDSLYYRQQLGFT